ncbi:MAG: bifunctional nuclease family protein [Blastocatellia bacterium]|nr:bifunctional nuclease family protein [Blastocatellia bacterium]
MKEIQIEKIAYQWNNPYGIWVVLKEKRKKRLIPICIGQFEGMAILRGLENTPQPRPWTHDLLAATLEALGVEVKHIVLTKMENNTFYAAIVVESHGSIRRIDARPSDALALAVLKKVPIMAEEELLGMDSKAKPQNGEKVEIVVPSLVTLWPVESKVPPKPVKKRRKKIDKRA